MKRQDIIRIPGYDAASPASLEAAFRALEAAFGVQISLSDRAALFLTADGQPLFPPARMRHEREYCNWGREQSAFDQACLSHCSKEVQDEAGRAGRPFLHCCWKGATELVVPVMHEGAHVCTLSAGTWASPRPWGALLAARRPAELDKLHAALPPFDQERIFALAGPLELLGRGLVALWLPHLQEENSADRQDAIRRFLHLRVTEEVRLQDLAEYLHLSPSRTGTLVREYFGFPFQEAVLRERLRRARYLLLHSRHPVKLIAAYTGFGSEYYFSRVFTRREGIPPARWRKQQQPGEFRQE